MVTQAILAMMKIQNFVDDVSDDVSGGDDDEIDTHRIIEIKLLSVFLFITIQRQLLIKGIRE